MILIDAHVHIYNCFDLQVFFDSAFKNFQKEALRQGEKNDFTAILLLTETAKDNWFHNILCRLKEEGRIGIRLSRNWTIHCTNENFSLLACRNDGKVLFLIAGRQIVTKENLEVLALIIDNHFEDGAPIEEVIQTVRKSGAIPVIPWSPGKWMGTRGLILKNILNAAKDPELFLGDNSNRPIFWRVPSIFKLAQKKGIRVLPGSDLLPLASDARRPGSFGFLVEESINPNQPAKSIRHFLLDTTTHPKAYGKLESPYRFFRNQLLVHLIDKFGKNLKLAIKLKCN
jgi:hypothetical protein